MAALGRGACSAAAWSIETYARALTHPAELPILLYSRIDRIILNDIRKELDVSGNGCVNVSNILLPTLCFYTSSNNIDCKNCIGKISTKFDQIYPGDDQ